MAQQDSGWNDIDVIRYCPTRYGARQTGTAALLTGRGQNPWQALPTRVARRRTDEIDADLPNHTVDERAQGASERAIAGDATGVWSAPVPIEGVCE